MPGVSTRTFAIERTQASLNSVVFAMHEAARMHDAESVHRLRVSIRRFQQILRVFGEFFPRRGVDRIKEQMKEAMTAAGELRNLDIAMDLLKAENRDLPELAARKTDARKQLHDTLVRLTHRDLGVRWRKALGLP